MRIMLLGEFQVRLEDGGLADLPGARLRGLLSALALRPGQLVPKEALVDWIWAENPPADASNALQRLVSRLRKALPGTVIEGSPGGYLLRIPPDNVDAVRFERLVRAGEASAGDLTARARLLGEALGLWRGAALSDTGLADSAAFGAAVSRLEELRLTAAEARAEAETGLGHGAELVSELTGLLAAHPLRERLAAALMRALAAAGRGSEALLVYQRTREALAEALGADPSPELAGLHVALLRGEARQREASHPTNLRTELTSFVGRDADVSAVRELVGGHRLITLIGPGGSGKTRLAVETARAQLRKLPEGAWLVELAAIGPAPGEGDIARAALAALGLRDALLGQAPGTEPAAQLIAVLRDREALLILDNCEHVTGPAAAFAYQVLGECQRLRILATSREPIGITGEALWRVPPLALPREDAGPAEITASAAVRLLRDRASAVRPGLAAGPATPETLATLETMARICRALDGMPLAIELAAARLRTMTVNQLASRLDDRFRLLTGGSRTALPRHQTLRAVIDWSWELLTGPEQLMLRRVSVFRGGVSLEAAERVGTADDAIGRDDVLDLLTALAEKSLLVADGDGAPRYRMTGTIRDYAGQRLAESGESELARQAHLAFFTELAETAEPRLRRAGQLEWLAALGAEHRNIGTAVRGALAAGETAAAMRLAAGAGLYWWIGGHRTEGIELLTSAARAPGEVPDEIQARVYALIVMFLTSSGWSDERQAEDWIHQAYRLGERSRSRHPDLRLIAPLERLLTDPGSALTVFEPLTEDEDPWVRALARWQLGKMRIVLGQDAEAADGHLEQALAEFRALGERYGISIALTELADRSAVRGDFAGACERYEQAIAVITEIGATEDVIRMRSRQAQLYWLLGDEAASAAALAEALRRAERVTWPDTLGELALAQAELARWRGNAGEARQQLGVATAILAAEAERPPVRAVTQDLLGYLAGDLAEARARHAAACQAAAEAGYPPLIAKVLAGVADLALRAGEPGQAARLLGASRAIRGLRDHSQPDLARIERAARSRRGDTGFAAAAQEGMLAAQAGDEGRPGWHRLTQVTLASGT